MRHPRSRWRATARQLFGKPVGASRISYLAFSDGARHRRACDIVPVSRFDAKCIRGIDALLCTHIGQDLPGAGLSFIRCSVAPAGRTHRRPMASLRAGRRQAGALSHYRVAPRRLISRVYSGSAKCSSAPPNPCSESPPRIMTSVTVGGISTPDRLRVKGCSPTCGCRSTRSAKTVPFGASTSQRSA